MGPCSRESMRACQHHRSILLSGRNNVSRTTVPALDRSVADLAGKSVKLRASLPGAAADGQQTRSSARSGFGEEAAESYDDVQRFSKTPSRSDRAAAVALLEKLAGGGPALELACFENVATHLTDDGVFLIEAFRPDFLYRLRGHQYVDAEAVEVDEVRLDVARHDPVTQLLEESHVSLSREGVRLNPIVIRYAWPSELDHLMARIVGLRLKDRWGGWDRSPLTSTSKNVVSVYGRSASISNHTA